jgi:Kdo2-lipid IVA lauroyltransferase/acyltransferase
MYYFIYSFLWLISIIPIKILYVISDGFYVLVYYVFQYRKDVVLKNLLVAFPEKTEAERVAIAKQFYHNFIDTLFESIKFITISKKKVLSLGSADFEIIHQLVAKGKNVHLMSGHQFNWEFGNVLYPLNLNVPFVGIYMPFQNKHVDKIFFNFRKKYGTVLISAGDFKARMHRIFVKQYVMGLVADQNPGDPAYAYWMNFFGKPAPFITGPGRVGVKKNTAIVVVGFKKIKRGHYRFTNTLLTENGSEFTPQQLTLMYKNELEKVIRNDPANYLWSHRRWKHEWKTEYGDLIK